MRKTSTISKPYWTAFSRNKLSTVNVSDLGYLFHDKSSLHIHCDKKWAKRSFPLENNLPEEGKFPCGYWNIYPFTHTVFIHSSVREKCSRPWAGTFYRSKKGKLPGVDFSHRYFRKIPAFRISQGNFRKIPAFPREECSRCPLPPWLILEKLTL